MLGQPGLRSVFAGDINIKTNTAICLVLCGVSLMLLAVHPIAPRRREIAGVLALIPIAIGLATMAEHVFGWNLGIDQLLFREDVGAWRRRVPTAWAHPRRSASRCSAWRCGACRARGRTSPRRRRCCRSS